MPAVSRETLEPLLPPEADAAQLQAYYELLADEAVRLGLIGPREASRLWERHLGNAVWVVLPAPGLVPLGSSVADVGSGAGLPGLAWAIVRPDLQVTLIEPLLRRSAFLDRAVAELGLSARVEVLRARAEDVKGSAQWDIVTARAVAPMDRLLGWTFPLTRPGGAVLALKGAAAQEELRQAGTVLRRLRAGSPRIEVCGNRYSDSPTRVVVVPRPATEGG
jgi:16S rRNA (guanine527-N7)-methyltransferase